MRTDTPGPETAGSTWARSHDYTARGLVRPRSVAEVRDVVLREPRLRALGSRHSFTDLADSPGVLVSLDGLEDSPTLTGEVVRVPGGMRYGELAAWLQERGRALPNLASLPHISVAGAVATGTHGSGVGNGSLATSVTALEIVDGRGELVRLEAGSADFAGAVVGLGALGIVTHLELRTSPTFEVEQTVHEGLTYADLREHLTDILGAAYSVSVFTRWADEPDGSVARVWVKSRTGTPEIPGATLATEPHHVIPGLDPAPCTEQLGVPGPWHERLPHFRLDFQPSVGAELQSEYLVPLDRAQEAVDAVRSLTDRVRPLLLVGEIRAVAADELWLSPAYGTDTLALHFTWKADPDGVRALLPELEERLPEGTRPHWGKLFATADPGAGYPRWDDFRDLVRRFDPERRFWNAWLDRVLG
ncbi:xylitol oxidase [Nocardioides luteus]|uniref:Xylitol oxidase n=1 Tax=Nocardioides luteus TaxID=1844 RepID=A0ABQ5SX43_9ACTN|nr:FAD-binding protein [Nocardioides luteus]MDR7311828.1 xylitol oxidase [Nocardioides luteus]GGR71608.1 putative xylitol oxidase [Nocardioides luteus]GLJ68072.1 putative xylitol oxidase [Nocardioides luteus]